MADNNQINDWEDVPITDWEDVTTDGAINPPAEVGIGEALKTGAFQGLSFDLIDELAGALEAGGQAVGVKGLGAPSISQIETQAPKWDWEKLKEAYKSARDVRREQQAQAEEQQPVAQTIGQFASGLAIPGGAALASKGGLGLKFTKGVAAGAGAGALSGLGASEAETAGEQLEEAKTGAITGGLIGAAAIPVMAGTKGLINFAKQQGLVESATEITKDAAKGILHSGDDILNKRADEMVKAGQGILKEAQDTMLAQAKVMEDVVTNLDKKAVEAGESINVEPVLQKFKQLNTILDIPTQEQVNFLEDVVNKAAGKGDINTVMSALNKKVAEEQVKKIIKARKIAEKIMSLEEEIAAGKSTPGVATQLDSLKAAYKEATDQLNLSGLEDQYQKITKDISSVTPFQKVIDPATGVPVGVIDTDYQTFVKASEGITKYSPEKTPAEIREMIKRINADYVVKNIDTDEAIKLRTDIKNELQDMMFTGATSPEKSRYVEASKQFSDLKKLLEGAKLEGFYGLGEAGKRGTDERKLYDIIKQFQKEGSKEGAFFRQFVDKLKNINPELAQKVEADVSKASRDFKLSSDLYADKAFPEKGLMFFAPSGKSLMMKSAEGIGKAINVTDKALTGVRNAAITVPRKLIESIDTGNSDKIRQFADKLRNESDKTSIDLYNKLNAMLEMSPNKQKATLFTLIQQPAFRGMLSNAETEDESK